MKLSDAFIVRSIAPRTFRLVCSIVFAVLGLTSMPAQMMDDSPVGIPVRIWGKATTGSYNAGHSFDLLIWSVAADGSTTPVSYLNGQPTTVENTSIEIPADTARFEPGKRYKLTVTAEFLAQASTHISAPPGYSVEIDGVLRGTYTVALPQYEIIDHEVSLRILPLGEAGARAGSCSSLSSGKIRWKVALGFLKNGASAGHIVLSDAALGSTWPAVFVPAGLQYEPPSSEVTVSRASSNQALQQIVANQACVNIVTLSATSYEMRFYHPDQKVGSAFPYSFTGSPYVSYKIERDGSDTKLKITSTSRSLATGSTARTAVTTLERTGTGVTNYQWKLQDWHTDGVAALVEEQRTWGGTTADRTESQALRQPAQSDTLNTTKAYHAYAWGEELASINRGATNSINTVYGYYTDPAQKGSYAFIKSASSNDGTWEAFDYYDANSDQTLIGLVHHRYRPFNNEPTTVSLDGTLGEITTYEYAADAFGRLSRPTQILTQVKKTASVTATTAKTEFAYVDSDGSGNALITANGMRVVETTRKDYSSAANYLETVTRNYREDVTDDFFRSQTHSVRRPDNVQQSFAYQRGTWNGTAFTKAANNGLDPGPASRIAVVTGSALSAAGGGMTAYDGYDIEDIYLVDGKSTLEVTIRDSRALVVRTETHAWKSNAWNLVGSVGYTYDAAGQLTGRTSAPGGQYQATYAGEQKTSETSETGITISYGYDVAGRVKTAAKASGPTTTFAYDAAGQVVSETRSKAGVSETIMAARSYDTAGRLQSTTPPGLSATSYTYNVSARTRTATAPGNGTTVSTTQRDGRLASVTGSAVVAEHFAYDVESDGRQFTQVYSGSLGSSRWTKTWTDWLGRVIKTVRPGFSQSGQLPSEMENFYDDATVGKGRLFKTTRTGYAPTRYEYDALGALVLTGLDVNSNGLVLNSSDRVTGQETFYQQIGSHWWSVTETRSYPVFNASTVITTTKRTRLTGHLPSRLAEEQEIDHEGNVVSRTTDFDGFETVTITTSGPCECPLSTQTMVNGLTTSIVSRDNLTYSTQYDGLERRWKETDPRSNTTTLAYVSGSERVFSVTDQGGNVLSRNTYDTLGRITSVQDASSKYTRYAYNKRNQRIRQWGDATYPFEVTYSSFGEQIAQRTFRTGTAWGDTVWPLSGADATIDATTGNPDPTAWISGDKTLWAYDVASGLLWKKTDAGTPAQVTEFDYNFRGQTSSRKWARTLTGSSTKVTTTYGYDGNTGELLTKTYNDQGETIPTPDVTYTYTRLGQTKTVDEKSTEGGVGQRTFNYDSATPWRLASETLPGFFGSRQLTRLYETSNGTGTFGSYTKGTLKGRETGYELGTAANPDRDLHSHRTHTNLGRFVGVSATHNEGATQDFVYTYETGSRLMDGYTAGSFSTSRDYDTSRDLVTRLEAKWSGASLLRYDSAYNSLGQRTTAKQSGTAFTDYYQGLGYAAVFQTYAYNSRGELQTAALYRGNTPSTTPPTGDELPGRRFEYRYDSAGNRKSSGSTGASNGVIDTTHSGDDDYQTNGLNQVTSRENNLVQVMGTVATAVPVQVSGAGLATRKDRVWSVGFVPANTTGPVQGTVTVNAAQVGGGGGGADLIRTDTRSWFAPAAAQAFGHDADGNPTSDGVWTCKWNAENQLVRMVSSLPAGSGFTRYQIDFKYDHMGRRIEKKVTSLDGATGLPHRRYVYDGWNLIAELDATGAALVRSFVWGADQTGSRAAVSGAGALLRITNYTSGVPGTSYYPAYDGNGNVTALVNAGSGALAAVYEYDPYGNLVRHEVNDPAVADNPFRFSTKYTDGETGLAYYGYRYYDPRGGRFVGRDPVGEEGGLNLYGFVANDPINRVDLLGMIWQDTITLPPVRAEGGWFGDPNSISIRNPRGMTLSTDNLNESLSRSRRRVIELVDKNIQKSIASNKKDIQTKIEEYNKCVQAAIDSFRQKVHQTGENYRKIGDGIFHGQMAADNGRAMDAGAEALAFGVVGAGVSYVAVESSIAVFRMGRALRGGYAMRANTFKTWLGFGAGVAWSMASDQNASPTGAMSALGTTGIDSITKDALGKSNIFTGTAVAAGEAWSSNRTNLYPIERAHKSYQDLASELDAKKAECHKIFD